MKQGNMQVGCIVEEIVDFVSPSVDVALIVNNKHVKAQLWLWRHGGLRRD